jgi:hypothetical protein
VKLVQLAVASDEAQWLLYFQLACICQQLQHKSKRKEQQQQQQQQQQPAFEQLLTALGLPTGVQYSSYYEFKDTAETVHALLYALLRQLGASQRVCSLTRIPTAAATAEVASDATQQQQQQQQDDTRVAGVANLAMRNSRFSPAQLQERCEPALAAHLVTPLLLTLLQLCLELLPTLDVMIAAVMLMQDVLSACWYYCERNQWASTPAARHAVQAFADARSSAGSATGVPVVPVDLTEVLTPAAAAVEMPQQSTAQPQAAAAAAAAKVEMEAAYLEARRRLVQPLLHVLGPAVLKEVRRVEQGLNRGSVSSRIAVLPDMTAEESATLKTEKLLDAFGTLVVQVIARRK